MAVNLLSDQLKNLIGREVIIYSARRNVTGSIAAVGDDYVLIAYPGGTVYAPFAGLSFVEIMPIYIFYEPFSSLEGWDTLDATLLEEYKEKQNVVKLLSSQWAAPYIKRELSEDETPTERNYIWYFQVCVPSFDFRAFGQYKDATVLGELMLGNPINNSKIPGFAVVLDKNGRLGLQEDVQSDDFMNKDPVYSQKPVITADKWEDIYVRVYGSENKIMLFRGSENVLTHSWERATLPVREIWLGHVFLGGKGNYGVPIDGVYYGEVALLPC